MQINTTFIALGTTLFEEVVVFYQTLCQQEPQVYQAHRYAEFLLPGLKLAIFVPQAAQELEFSQSRLSGLSLCFSVDNLDTAIAHLQRIGYDQTWKIQTVSHGRELLVYDPAGNRLIFYSPNAIHDSSSNP
ncbi:MAG: VOC family protein [Microcystaceae cyanobacterium]